jgi:hypothetical protein
MKIQYSLPDETREKIFTIDTHDNWCMDRPIEQKQLLELCASNCYYNQGWDELYSWPMKIALHHDGKSIAQAEVHLDFTPEFNVEVL